MSQRVGGWWSAPGGKRLWMAVMLGGALLCSQGCALAGYIAYVIRGPNKEPKIAQEYFKMENKTVAVLVSADDRTLYQFPSAPAAICRYVSRRLSAEVPGVTPLDPEQVIQFQAENPYWNTTPRSELFQRLRVDRLVVVDVAEYSTHDPGDANLWRGVLVAGVGVGEAESTRPDDLVYYRKVEVSFPPNQTIGLTNSDDATIQHGMLTRFSTHVRKLVHAKK
jgi:hypothetical protein